MHKKHALNFAEIVILIFIAVVILCIVLGNIFSVSQESKVIYNWKQTLKATQYSYQNILLTEQNKIRALAENESEKRNVEIINLFTKTLSADVISMINSHKSLKNYKYRFLNGTAVPKDSKYYVEDFAYSKNGESMIGLKWINNNCFEKDEICGVILFDMNGTKLPNRFGLDVFGANIYKDKLEPFGNTLSYKKNEQNCRRLETGITCSKFYLMGGQFFK